MKNKIEYYAKRYLGLGKPITSTNVLQDIVKNENELRVVGNPEHGSHKLAIVQDASTGKEYVSKQTSSHSETEKEFMMASFLNLANPDHPECLLGENEDGSVSVLSLKRENTQDVEQFIKEGRTPELLTKNVVGLSDTLLADNILGKQSDTKYANMLVTDKGNTLVFSNIDHERANSPTFNIFDSGQSKYPTTSEELIHGIHDLYEPSDDNHAGLAGDQRAKEFAEIAKKVITEEQIQASYKKIASANTDLLHAKCSALAQNSIFYNGRNSCDAYQQYFKEIQKNASATSSKFEM